MLEVVYNLLVNPAQTSSISSSVHGDFRQKWLRINVLLQGFLPNRGSSQSGIKSSLRTVRQISYYWASVVSPPSSLKITLFFSTLVSVVQPFDPSVNLQHARLSFQVGLLKWILEGFHFISKRFALEKLVKSFEECFLNKIFFLLFFSADLPGLQRVKVTRDLWGNFYRYWANNACDDTRQVLAAISLLNLNKALLEIYQQHLHGTVSALLLGTVSRMIWC